MNKAQTALVNYLEGGSLKSLSVLSPTYLAEVFTTCCFLQSSLHSISDQEWILKDADKLTEFLERALAAEMTPIAYLRALLDDLTPKKIKKLEFLAKSAVSSIIEHADVMENFEFREFASAALQEMVKAVRFDSKSNSLYRTFDPMDAIFRLDYEKDRGMQIVTTTTERLYEGAGVGVQSSYAVLLAALERIKAVSGARLIDLGSGYGRVGLISGLLRPDVQFIGYEFVPHRVQVSCDSAERAGVGDRVRFIAQDLSDPLFVIPDAEIYYLYDPFTEETYQHVFRQLDEIGQRIKIMVVTKGNAGEWFQKATRSSHWMTPEVYDQNSVVSTVTGQVLPGLFTSVPAY